MGIVELFLIAVGLSMDAFAVSICKGLSLNKLKLRHAVLVGLYFGGFQALMPLLGWLCVRTIAESFTAFEKFIPWIALLLLLCIGGKMLLEGIRGGAEEEAAGEKKTLGRGTLLLQGVATSIDALSVGFTIEQYPFAAALTESLIIGAVTLAICLAGLLLGRTIGRKLDRIAPILGGLILIGIGVEIFLTGVF